MVLNRRHAKTGCSNRRSSRAEPRDLLGAESRDPSFAERTVCRRAALTPGPSPNLGGRESCRRGRVEPATRRESSTSLGMTVIFEAGPVGVTAGNGGGRSRRCHGRRAPRCSGRSGLSSGSMPSTAADLSRIVPVPVRALAHAEPFARGGAHGSGAVRAARDRRRAGAPNRETRIAARRRPRRRRNGVSG